MGRSNYIPPKKGQLASAESASVVLSTEQEAMLSDIMTTGGQAVDVLNEAFAAQGTAIGSVKPIIIGAEDSVSGNTDALKSSGGELFVKFSTSMPINDNGATLSVDDGGGSLTVDGTVGISGTVTVASHAVTNAGTFAVQVNGDALAALQLIDDTVVPVADPVPGKGIAVIGADGSDNARFLKTDSDGHLQVDILSGAGGSLTYGTDTSMTVTNLNSLANSATAGWQSDRVSNVSTKAKDYIIGVKLTMANTAPANDKAAYVYICPFWTSDAGTTWYAASQGTTTLPTGTQGTTTIASPNNLKLLGVLNYTTQNMVLQDTFLLSNCFGTTMPQGFSIIIINFTGAAIAASTNLVSYTAIT